MDVSNKIAESIQKSLTDLIEDTLQYTEEDTQDNWFNKFKKNNYNQETYQAIRNFIDSTTNTFKNNEKVYESIKQIMLTDKAVKNLVLNTTQDYNSLYHSLLLTTLIEYTEQKIETIEQEIKDYTKATYSDIEKLETILKKSLHKTTEIKQLKNDLKKLIVESRKQEYGFIGLKSDKIKTIGKKQGIYAQLTGLTKAQKDSGLFAHKTTIINGKATGNSLYKAFMTTFNNSEARDNSLSHAVNTIFNSSHADGTSLSHAVNTTFNHSLADDNSLSHATNTTFNDSCAHGNSLSYAVNTTFNGSYAFYNSLSHAIDTAFNDRSYAYDNSLSHAVNTTFNSSRADDDSLSHATNTTFNNSEARGNSLSQAVNTTFNYSIASGNSIYGGKGILKIINSTIRDEAGKQVNEVYLENSEAIHDSIQGVHIIIAKYSTIKDSAGMNPDNVLIKKGCKLRGQALWGYDGPMPLTHQIHNMKLKLHKYYSSKEQFTKKAA